MTKIVAFRVQMKQNEVVVTSVGQSPRGTKVLLKQAVAHGRKGPKKDFKINIQAALKEVYPSDNLA